ncbi:MAG: AAA family ATPase [Candidatus Doudnabacteria bacterium]|nr:AAA family ATPase [Candidatus Doudnabacteria bacterium]
MSDKQLIIGLVGEKLAGKDTVAEYLVSKHGAAHFRFTHILDAVLEELDMPISRTNEITLGLSLRKVFGQHVLVNALEDRVRKSWATLIVVNGIRMDELEVVKSWGAHIIYVTAPVEVRFERYTKRHEKADDGAMDLESFKKQDQGPTELDIPELGKQADYKIENVGNYDELYASVDKILNTIKQGQK